MGKIRFAEFDLIRCRNHEIVLSIGLIETKWRW